MLLAEAIVTRGYLYTAILVMALYVALKDRANVNLITALAVALGLGLFVVAMIFIWPSLFPAIGGAVGGYVGL